MSETLNPTVAPLSIPVPRWTFAVLAAALFASYLMLQENGALLSQWQTLHELFHDGRHALGMPCH